MNFNVEIFDGKCEFTPPPNQKIFSLTVVKIPMEC